MKKLFSRLMLSGAVAALIASLSPPAALADSGEFNDCSMPAYTLANGGGYKFNQMGSKVIPLSSTTTQGTANFGFEADVVMIEVQAPNTGNGAWFRMGTTLTDSQGAAQADVSGMTVVATSPTNFINGTGATKGSAVAIVTEVVSTPASPASALELRNLSRECVWLPLKTRGMIVVHGSTTLVAPGVSENVTVHVRGFNQAGTE